MGKTKRKTKFIFVTGGVVSSLGKGVAAASLGTLLEMRGLKVGLTKMDPYINVDPGTMSPFQHGEVFVTDDGAETDLDLGHYSRFTSAKMSAKNSFTAGRVYETVIQSERQGKYLGATIQVIPHITDQIKENIRAASEKVDISIIEVGGTVGDIEGLPFLEAIRQLRLEEGPGNVLFVHLTLIPYIRAAGEVKTKPTQHSVQKMREIGIQPDVLICRTETNLTSELKQKISLFCNVTVDAVIEAPDVDNIYRIPLIYHSQGLDEKIIDLLGMWTAAPDLDPWKQFINRAEYPKQQVVVGLVGKYTDNADSYISINEALSHGGALNEIKVEIRKISSDTLTAANVADHLQGLDGILIPGGFGDRGITGKIEAVRFARENKIPFFGICLGMQVASIEFARNVCDLQEANSEEFIENPKETDDLVIHFMADQRKIAKKGGTMRLGAYPCQLLKGSKASRIYGNQRNISERHRHRYEFNNTYRSVFEAKGLIFSGTSPDNTLVEIIEIKNHPFFVACQFHPEFKSSPMFPSPLFAEFVSAAALKSSTQEKSG